MTPFNNILDRFGRWLAGRLESDEPSVAPYIPTDRRALRRTLRTGDVLLIAGSSTISTAIKYLTQSTWSHATLYVGDALDPPADGSEPHVLIEVTATDGCVSIPLSKYDRFHTRICRPVGLTEADRDALVAFMISRIGSKYDMRNILDLARYLMPTPHIPSRFRRRMIALGSGEPTRTICSTLIAEAFGRIGYPILPRIERLRDEAGGVTRHRRREILHIRHYSLYAPADFDLSPYFEIVKPTIAEGFNYKGLSWAQDDPQTPAKSSRSA